METALRQRVPLRLLGIGWAGSGVKRARTAQAGMRTGRDSMPRTKLE